MPRRDGSGSQGGGPKTGRGLGRCTGVNAEDYGTPRGRGCRRIAGKGPGKGGGRGAGRGAGRGYSVNQTSSGV